MPLLQRSTFIRHDTPECILKGTSLTCAPHSGSGPLALSHQWPIDRTHHRPSPKSEVPVLAGFFRGNFAQTPTGGHHTRVDIPLFDFLGPLGHQHIVCTCYGPLLSTPCTLYSSTFTEPRWNLGRSISSTSWRVGAMFSLMTLNMVF